MKALRIGRRRARSHDHGSSPLELALRPALSNDRWAVPDRFNFARDVVEALATDPKRQALTFIGHDGVIEPRTFLELAEGAAVWRRTLAEHGVQPKDRILLVGGSSVHWLEIALGAMKLGAVTVPCLPTASSSTLERRVTSTDASLVVAERSAERAIERMSFDPEVVYIQEDVRRKSDDVPKDAPTHDTSSRDLAFVFTSPGASGPPKEVAHTHGSVFAARVQAEHWLDAGRGDVVWCTAEADSPLHAWFTLVGPWSRGAEVVLHQGPFDVQERLEHVYRLGPTILCQSPAEYRAMATHHRLERYRPPHLRRLVSTGDVLEPEVRHVFEERWGLTIHDGYGQAETNIVIAGDGELTDVPGALGRPLPGYELAVIDDQGNELPAGIEGDLAVRGHPPTLFGGYWDATEETKRAFRGDSYVTGDVAIADEEGRLVFVGRAEDLITSSGRTFGPYAVEHLLRSHDAIGESAVVGIRDLQRGGHFVRAFVVLAPRVEGSEQLEAELRRYLGELLPEQQVPREIVFVDALPAVAGKVDRAALREQPISGRPLWELPPTSEPDVATAEAQVREPEPAPPPVAEVLPVVVVPAPEPPSEAPPAPEPPVVVVAPEPVAVVEPEPVVVEPEPVHPEPVWFPVPAEPEPAPEPEPVAEAPEPEPAAPVEPEPVALVEAEPVVAKPIAVEPPAEPGPLPEPQPVAEPVALVEPETPPAPEPMPEAAEPEPEPVATPQPAPLAEAPLAEAPAVGEPEPEPEARPEFRVVPRDDSASGLHALSEPEEELELGPLPDFVVVPGSTPVPPPEPVRLPEPEPEPEPDLGPLPDYVVDPNLPQPPRQVENDRRQAAEAAPSFPGLVRVPPPAEDARPEPSRAEAAGIYFPPVTSFPAPREDEDEDGSDRRERKPTRRRPTADDEGGKSKRKRSLEEPGDDQGDADWMAGLSNRLSAYSLAEDGSELPADEDPPGDAGTG